MTRKMISQYVDSCEDCPYMEEDRIMGGRYCTQDYQQSGVIPDGIPDWCPLPDAPDADAQAARIAELEAQVSAWPHIPEVDEERDECAVLEVGR